MVKGRNNVIEWLTLNDTRFWKLRNYRTKDIIGTSPEGDTTLQASIDVLNKYLDAVGNGEYSIEAWESEGQKKERKNISFVIGDPLPVQGISGLPVNAGLSVQEEIKKAIEQYEKDQEIKNLKLKIETLEAQKKELEGELNSAELRIGSKLSPYIGVIMESLGFEKVAEAAAVAGGGDSENATENEKRLNAAFESWVETDPGDIVSLVEKIAKLAKDDPGTYQMAKTMLMSK